MKTTRPTFYMRQIDDLAVAFSAATGLVLTLGVVLLLAFTPEARLARGQASPVEIVQTTIPAQIPAAVN
ncbi:MAG: hypothetical protein CMI63_18220 [Parvularcula sp.]|uniref:hypothetical protein n=1 Tax=Hyphococcus sp. TaxID=2038636 RepID=UPI000C396BDC|nr:hypothetical protein [Parvularcula sp.]